MTEKAIRPLGYRAEQVIAFELRFFIDHGRLPTQSQICAAVGISTKGEVSRIEKALARRGLQLNRHANR
jgi:hypothetical protein